MAAECRCLTRLYLTAKMPSPLVLGALLTNTSSAALPFWSCVTLRLVLRARELAHDVDGESTSSNAADSTDPKSTTRLPVSSSSACDSGIERPAATLMSDSSEDDSAPDAGAADRACRPCLTSLFNSIICKGQGQGLMITASMVDTPTVCARYKEQSDTCIIISSMHATFPAS